MTNGKMLLIGTLLASLPVFGQDAPPSTPAADEIQAQAAVADAQAALQDTQGALRDAQTVLEREQVQRALSRSLENLQIDRLGSRFALLQAPQPPQPQPAPQARRATAALADAKARTHGAPDVQYETGARLLDNHQYDEAIARFDRVIAAKTDRADGALYWKAYALNRIGRRDEALAAVATLRHDYPQSRWLNDAQVLEAEVKQNAGRPVSPADESNEDIKLMAINSLMGADPDRAIPLLENLLKSDNSPRLKDRALFVLTQNRSPKAQQILADYAKGAGNPDLQMRAIRYIGASGTAESQQQLAAIYGSSNDAAVKREILRSLMTSGAKEQLVNVARNEKDTALRAEAIRQLGAMRATDQLFRLYTPDVPPETRNEIIRALMVSGAGDRLLELARGEKDQSVRSEAIRNLSATRSTTADALVNLYTPDTEPRIKRELINGLFSRGDAKPLIEIARRETDPVMKKFIVERLAAMRNSKEATDYMMELLK
jgi:TolA-binding protein